MCRRPNTHAPQPFKVGLLASELIPSIELSVKCLASKLEKSSIEAGSFGSSNHDNVSLDSGYSGKQMIDNSVESRKPCESTTGLKSPTSLKPRRSSQEAGYTANNKKRVYVQHNYHDHANDPIEDKKLDSKTSSSFPFILHNLLKEVETQGWSHVISWMPHGRAFMVHDQDAFVKRRDASILSGKENVLLPAAAQLVRIHALDKHGTGQRCDTIMSTLYEHDKI